MTVPKNIGYVLFPSFDALDVFGPLDALNLLSLRRQLNLSLIAETLEAVSTKPRAAAMNKFNSNFGESVLPTHTFAGPPDDLDVLFVPGGLGTRAPDLNTTIDFVRATYPSLKYLVSICTGAGIVARAGVLDGRRATTNKLSWNSTIVHGPKTYWVSHARWVVDGNVWSTSGVSAGIDGTLAWIEHVYGNDSANWLADGMEYQWHTDWRWDPFSDLYDLKDVPPVG
jgi:transcriptional regulator GlxA family with amidase domain